MKDKKIFKKWWFWVIVAVVVLGAIGSLGQTDTMPTEPIALSKPAPDAKVNEESIDDNNDGRITL